jgi:hypothetical protein
MSVKPRGERTPVQESVTVVVPDVPPVLTIGASIAVLNLLRSYSRHDGDAQGSLIWDRTG